MNVKKQIQSFLSSRMHGERSRDIILYWLPELITATILISLPPLIDSWIVSQLGSNTTYGALAMGTNFLHTLIKLAEAIPVASIAIIGRHNGAGEYEQCGQDLGDTFWTTFIFGCSQFLIIFLSAKYIYQWLGVPAKMIPIGAEFLRIKAFGVFLIFTILCFVGFMRALKNTRVPMLINMLGIAVFIVFDYMLVLGHFGFPKLGLKGSAIATIVQYSVMNVVALCYILFNPDYKKYFTTIFFAVFSWKRALHLINLSWPIVIDKSTITFSYVWLSKMIASMGKYAITSYDVVKNLERFAILPVAAAAQVVTFLVSNRLGAGDPEGAVANIKKMFMLSFATVIPSLFILSINAPYFVSFFDKKNKFGNFAASVLPIITFLVIFDFTQLVLAGALRGAGDVRTVMWGRLFSCACFFIPVSYVISQLPQAGAGHGFSTQTTGMLSAYFMVLPPISNELKFILIYGSFYVTTGLMGIIFVRRIKSRKWLTHKV
ncbi:MAG: MATE family efflux transporter [Epsilonproteobacteria bacterium]|nr:MATE family efflux transporter [Campylobacterota bacterium]